MANLVRYPAAMQEKDCFGFFDDFLAYGSGETIWTNLAADGGVTAFAEGDAVRGRIQGATGATDNNEIAVRLTNEPFLVAAGKPLFCEARIQYTEQNTDDANVFFGFANAIAANTLIDDGGGVRASGSIACIYKIDGGTVWRCTCRDNDGVEDDVSDTTAGGSSYQVLRIEITDNGTLPATVTYWVDDAQLRKSDGTLIKHQFTLTSATEMQVGLYVKAGSANSETMNADYIAAYQVR